MLNALSRTIRQTRQHHALEHATLHMLVRKLPGRRFSGYSDPSGFSIIGRCTTDELRSAAEEGLRRLQGGESRLAIHPNCGTLLVTTAVMVTLVALLASPFLRNKDIGTRFTNLLVLIVPTLILSRPVGYRFQGLTTLADVQDRQIARVYEMRVGFVTFHRVEFAMNSPMDS
ncbi:MAG: DUF6391 domain-containing protein [Chloroflexota bacterium]